MLTAQTARPETQDQAERRLSAAGWSPGLPDHIDAGTLTIDLRIATHYRCPECHRRKMRGRAWHHGRKYLVLASCTGHDCNAAEVL